MKWESITKEDSSIQIPGSWLFSHYYDALNALFRIENALRVLVYVVLKNEFRDRWLDINTTSDDAAQSTIGKIAKQRMNQTRRFGYLGYYIPCPLMYMTSGELVRLIVSDSYWKHFNSYFLGSKDIISNKLDEINSVRNALAHFRPIKQDDIDLIKQNARHVLLKVESSLVDMMRCANIVPTNTQEEWYKQLKTLGTEQCRFFFNQSDDEKWIKVSFEHSCSVLNQEYGHCYRRYRVLNLNTSAILHCFPQLQVVLISLSEEIQHFQMRKDETPNFRKSIAMIFSRETLSVEYKIIKQQIGDLLLKLSEETSLLQDDHLARGELIQATDVTVSWKEYTDKSGYWSSDLTGLRCNAREDSPPEYWGQLSYVADDYVTSTESYPWMPVSVSEVELPF